MGQDYVKWDDAFDEELTVIAKTTGRTKEETKRALVGLAFSGGGIRSATFNLGILQALKSLDLLKHIHYLSTVSGGGYIGAWFSANCARRPGWLDQGTSWDESIGHLRSYSNYLSPLVGFFSADTWSMVMVWFRNALLVQATVVFALACVLLLPRVLFPLFSTWHDAGYYRWITIVLFILGAVGIAGNQLRVSRGHDTSDEVWILNSKNWLWGLCVAVLPLGCAFAIGWWRGFDPFRGGSTDLWAVIPIAVLLVIAGFCLLPVGVEAMRATAKALGSADPPMRINYSQEWVQAAVVAPMIVAGYLVAAVMWGDVKNHKELFALDSFGALFMGAWRFWPFPLMVVFSSLLLLSVCSVRTLRTPIGVGAALLAPSVSIVLLHALLCAVALLLQQWTTRGHEGEWAAVVWAPSAVVFVFSLAIVALIGMLGRESSEGVREWWSRLGAWLGIYGTAWMVVSLCSIYGPWLGETLLAWKFTVGGGWVASTVAGLLAGKSGSTGGTDASKSTLGKALEVVAAVAPYIFIAGLVVAVAWVVHLVGRMNSADVIEGAAYWSQLDGIDASLNRWLLVACTGLLVLLAARVDINEFSLNAFYRSRLVRCYLGATRKRDDRRPQAFTNFDGADDIPLAELAPGQAGAPHASWLESWTSGRHPAVQGSGPEAETRTLKGPLHIVNCALNLGGSSDLTVHTRHSASFTLTPLRTGSRYRRPEAGADELGYMSTGIYGGAQDQPTLGQAISVSGAAASPNMGYHTSPVVAFLLTVFNVRLGWWFPRPAPGGATTPSPWFSLRYLLVELLGLASERSRFLAISDGGHFENLAAYELIKRGCKVVIIGDGECDPHLNFEGLGTLIRMCEVDFGARIDIDLGSLAKDASGWSHSRCAVGRIHYADRDDPGILIYLKATMTGREGSSVLQYKASSAAFPHESTGDQFYSEGQFESHRLLGQDIAAATFAPATPVNGRPIDIVTMAERLADVWSPTLRHVSLFTQHSTRLMELWGEMSKRNDLDFLDAQITGRPIQPPRAGYYAGSQMLQLMENVYLDLRLDETWDHPDNKGWKELFSTWARSEVVKSTWERSGETYGLRFRYFCERKLGLPLPG